MSASHGARLNVAYAVSPKSTKWDRWHDGFTAAVDLLEQRFDVRWLNLHPDDIDQERSLDRLGDCDFLLVKSNWAWIVDSLVREHCKGGPPKGLMISGVADPPRRRRMRFYDVLFYETPWYAPRIRRHGCRVHAFGVDTRVMRPRAGVAPDIDWLSVGALRPYKRHEALIGRPGRRVVIGDLSDPDEEVLAALAADGVEVLDFLSYEGLADHYRRSRNVVVAAEVGGGGERSVLEARACGAQVQVAGDNPKLQSLARQGEIWDHAYYARQLTAGIRSARQR